MIRQERGERGRFTPKSGEYRKIRSIRLTEKTWQKLGEIADSQDLTRGDVIEGWVQSRILTGKVNIQQLDEAIIRVLSDNTVTYNGRDIGCAKRALEALRDYLNLE